MAMTSTPYVSLMSPLRRLSSSMSVLGISALAPVMAPASSVSVIRSYGRKANAAPAPPAAPLAKAAPEKKVPRQKREPSAYAKFVKAKFTSVRVRIVVFFLPFVCSAFLFEWRVCFVVLGVLFLMIFVHVWCVWCCPVHAFCHN